MNVHYFDMRLLPDAEYPAGTLLGEACKGLHRSLAGQQPSPVGMCFPEYARGPGRPSLGQVVRVFGPARELVEIMGAPWLDALREYVHLTPIVPVPANCRWRMFARKQFHSGIERMRRRRMKRHDETAEQAAKAIPSSAVDRPNLPSVVLHSASTRQRFRLAVEAGPVVDEGAPGHYGSYGLSRSAPAPWF